MLVQAHTCIFPTTSLGYSVISFIVILSDCQFWQWGVCVCNFIYVCICGCPVSLLPCRPFSSCGKWSLLSSWDVQVSRCGGFSCCRAWALGQVRGFSSCDSWILERRLNSCGPWVLLLHNLWDLSRSGLVLVSPVLAGEFFITDWVTGEAQQ